MATAMEMMLKSMGLDPAMLIGKAQEFQLAMNEFIGEMREIKEGVRRIEFSCAEIQLAINSLGRDNLSPLPDFAMSDFARESGVAQIPLVPINTI